MTAAPPPAAWDLALAGIAQLEQKIDGQGEQLRDLQAQLTDVRSAYTRAAPMASLLALEDRVGRLETGATAAILRRLDDDRRDRWLLLALLGGLILVGLLLFGALIWLGVR